VGVNKVFKPSSYFSIKTLSYQSLLGKTVIVGLDAGAAGRPKEDWKERWKHPPAWKGKKRVNGALKTKEGLN